MTFNLKSTVKEIETLQNELFEEIETLQDELFNERVRIERCYDLAYQWKDAGNPQWRKLIKALAPK